MVQLKNMLGFLQFIAFLAVVYGKVELVLEGSIEQCADGNSFDLSKLDFIPFNDTHNFLNGKYHNFGSFKFNSEIKAPWVASGTFERFQNGKWQQSLLSRKIPDFCSVMQNPIEPWYSITKSYQKELKCPIAAGTKLMFVNQQLNDFNIEFPPQFVGKWRLVLQNQVSTGLLKPSSRDCHRFIFDVVET